MNRKVLLVEPNYKNKYPPMGLMKLATYFRDSGDDVRFFKGNLQDLVMELDVDDLLDDLARINSEVKWRKYKQELLKYFRLGRLSLLDEIEVFSNDIIAYEMAKTARRNYKNKDYFENPRFDFVGITTLFTFYFGITIDTINFAKKLCKDPKNVMVGGIMASLLPDKVFKETGIHPFVGQLDKPGGIDAGDPRIIDALPLDYSILEEIDYTYPANNAYFGYMTRGCINKCAFCAVPTLEPKYRDYIGIKEQIEIATKRFGEQRDLLLLDNNILASQCYDKIIDEIKACGFTPGAKLLPVNEYQVAIQNLRDNYNNRAYIRKCISLYKEIMKKLPEKLQGDFYLLLESHDLLSVDTATREAILEIDDQVAPLYVKTHAAARPKKRIIDFNQGIDARLINDQNMKKMAEVCINPLRIAFDHWGMRETYEDAVRCAVRNGIKDLSNYMLYNFNDRPEELYYRMKLNAELCEELDASIYSFPMKYHPIFDEDYFMNRDFIGKNWNKKFVRAVQAVLNSTKGCIGRGLEFFYEAFGPDEDRFWTIMWMPEAFIIYRMKFKDNLAKKWEQAFKALPADKLNLVKEIVSDNTFKDIDLSKYDQDIQYVLQFYLITRDIAKDMVVETDATE